MTAEVPPPEGYSSVPRNRRLPPPTSASEVSSISNPGRMPERRHCSRSFRAPVSRTFAVGDHIRLVRQTDPNGNTQYSFEDYSRGLPLALIVIAFAVVIIAVARVERAARTRRPGDRLRRSRRVSPYPLCSTASPAIPVALVAGAVILYAVLYLAHGVSLKTSSALLGTLAAMVLAAVLSYLCIELTHLTGLSEEQNTNVQTYIEHIDITGLLLAGFIIGSLGVLNDVTNHPGILGIRVGRTRQACVPSKSLRRVRCGSDVITSPARSTPWFSRTRVGRCHCYCSSASAGAHFRTSWSVTPSQSRS